jgi:hypothetical protein
MPCHVLRNEYCFHSNKPKIQRSNYIVKEYHDSLNIKSKLTFDLGANYLKNTQRLHEPTLEVTLTNKHHY